MPAPAWEDLDEFFQLDTESDFATDGLVSETRPAQLDGQWKTDGTVTLNGERQIGFKLRGIFDYPMVQTHAGEYKQDTDNPTFLCKEVDTLGMKRRDKIALYGVTYELTSNPLPDGTGLATLKLAKVP